MEKGRSDDRQPLTALPATQGKDFAATPGGHAGAEPDPADTFFAMRAKGGLHGF
jgi:hypothetical protein